MRYGCIGEKLGHSFSTQIHALLGNDGYELREIGRDELAAFMQARDFAAINVTIPYKQAVMPYLDAVSDDAQLMGAVNTVVNRNGKLTGYNTDFGGMLAQLERMGADLKGKKALVLGTGGTGRTAVQVLKSMGAAQVVPVSRTEKLDAVTYEAMYAQHTDAAWIINATPVGMYPHVDACPVEVERFGQLEGVLDAVYNPLRTELVQRAACLGVRAEGGLYMLVMQAILAAEHFFDRPIARELAEHVYRHMLQEKENIVLIGMPGSGKSTVGRYLASRLERELKDTDSMVEEEQNCTIADIFEQDGEAAFRDMESQLIRRISLTGGKVISTGGGVVLRADNVKWLKMNGRVFFIDRDLGLIKPTLSRPLSQTREQLEQRYRERYPLYCAVCDHRVVPAFRQSKTAAIIEGMWKA